MTKIVFSFRTIQNNIRSYRAFIPRKNSRIAPEQQKQKGINQASEPAGRTPPVGRSRTTLAPKFHIRSVSLPPTVARASSDRRAFPCACVYNPAL